jgi:hypothetical protein
MNTRMLGGLLCCILLRGCSNPAPSTGKAHNQELPKEQIIKKESSYSKPKRPKLRMEWHRNPVELKKPEILSAHNVDNVQPCAASNSKCLADFNNPAESKLFLKAGDKRSAWHDARAGCLSPSCELGMNRSGGFNPKISFSI